MINTDGNILDKLTDSEYFLLSILINYGKKSHPKNDVLLKKTNWAIQKLQTVKKSLILKGFLIVNSRIDKNKGGKGSNEYVVNTKLLSKYNGFQLHDFHTIEIQLDENRVVEIQLDENRVVENRVHENHTIFKVLKVSIIESIKLLKDEESKRTPTFSDFENLQKRLLETQSKLLQLEAEKEKEKKVATKKEKGKHQFPKLNSKPKGELKTPLHKIDVIQFQETMREYEFAIKSYNYKNWTTGTIEAFHDFCRCRHDKQDGKFYSSQAMATIRQIELDTKINGFERVEKCLRLCSLNGWAYNIKYQINKESRENQDEIKRQKQLADDPNISTAELAVRQRFGDNIGQAEHQEGYNSTGLKWYELPESEQEF